MAKLYQLHLIFTATAARRPLCRNNSYVMAARRKSSCGCYTQTPRRSEIGEAAGKQEPPSNGAHHPTLCYIPAMRRALLFLALLAAGPALAANFATCILDKAPGAANDVAAQAVYQVCLAEHPGGLQAVPQGDGRGMFGFKSGAECTAKKAADTRSNQAAYMVGMACRRLYDEENPFAKFHR